MIMKSSYICHYEVEFGRDITGHVFFSIHRAWTNPEKYIKMRKVHEFLALKLMVSLIFNSTSKIIQVHT